MPKKTVSDFLQMKKTGEKIAWVTAYDFPTAQMVEAAGVDMILVGDSAARCVWGYSSVHRVTLDQMVVITDAVRRGAPNTFMVADLPFMTFSNVQDALANAERFYRETHCDSVILEGGKEICPQIKAIASNGMRVMGHLGMTPLSTSRIETAADVRRVVEDAQALEAAGAWAILLGFSPVEAMAALHQALTIPVLSGGSGASADGELQPITDIIGTFHLMPESMAARYADLRTPTIEAVKKFVGDIRSGAFPGSKGLKLPAQEAEKLNKKK